MFVFIKKIFYIGSLFVSSLVSTTSLNCISMKNQECKVRPEIINVNSNEPVFYPFSIKTNKFSGSCNNMNDPYAKICVPDVIKDLNVKVFNLMSRTNEEMNKYLVFDSTDENKELLKKYNDVFNGIRNKIKKISIDESDYEKDYMKIKFNSDYDLTLNKELKFHNITISISSVFEEDGKLYPQVFLDDT